MSKTMNQWLHIRRYIKSDLIIHDMTAWSLCHAAAAADKVEKY